MKIENKRGRDTNLICVDIQIFQIASPKYGHTKEVEHNGIDIHFVADLISNI